MNDNFTRIKSAVSVPEAARRYGLEPGRGNMVCCPFHGERHASMKLYDDHFYCFACGEHGSVIDLTARLLDLTVVEALVQLNADFALGLDLRRGPQPSQDEVRQRQLAQQAYEGFQRWRQEFLNRLCAAWRTIEAMEITDLNQLTAAQCDAFRLQDALDDMIDTLSSGALADQMKIFEERGNWEWLLSEISPNTPTK